MQMGDCFDVGLSGVQVVEIAGSDVLGDLPPCLHIAQTMTSVLSAVLSGQESWDIVHTGTH